MLVPNKGSLFEWASFIAILIVVVEALYIKTRNLVLIIAVDLRRVPVEVLHRVIWLAVAALAGAIIHNLWSA